MTTDTAPTGTLPAPAHQFEDLEQQRETCTLGMWAFLATEVMFFGGLFTGFLVYRFTSHEAFMRGSHQLNVWLGFLNTFVLLTSSLTVALAVHAGQLGDRRLQVRYLLATLALAFVFLGVKAVEYTEEYHKHLVPGLNFSTYALGLDEPSGPRPPSIANAQQKPLSGNDFTAARSEMFFVFYFFMTGLHAIHIVIGIGVFAVITRMAARGRFTPESHLPLELSGLYWHFVDIVWVFLFPLLYLIDRYHQ